MKQHLSIINVFVLAIGSSGKEPTGLRGALEDEHNARIHAQQTVAANQITA